MKLINYLLFVVLLLLVANCSKNNPQPPEPEPAEKFLVIKGILVVSLLERSGVYELRADTVQQIGDPIPPPVYGYRLISQIPAGTVLAYEYE